MRTTVVLAALAAMTLPALAAEPLPPGSQEPLKPVPHSPGENRAFLGGGVVLQSVPGEPAPPPSAVLGLPQNQATPVTPQRR